MDAVFRVTSPAWLKRNLLFAVLMVASLLLAACSSVQGSVPTSRAEGAASIQGTVLTNTYLHTTGTAVAPSPQSLAATTVATSGPKVLSTIEPASLPVRSGWGEVDAVPGQLLVQFRQDGFSPLSAGSTGAPTVVEVANDENLEEAAARLAAESSVDSVSPNYYLYPTAEAADPFLPEQWELAAAGVPLRPPTAGHEVVVAVIDTGFDLEHEDLAGRFLPGYDFCANLDCSAIDDNPGGVAAENWHGTHVAGVVAATANNGVGIFGVAGATDVRVLPIKVFNDGGRGANANVLIRGIRWAAGLPVEGAPINPNPARIINMSVAGDFHSGFLQATIDEVREAGALVVASTGNHGVDRVMAPAAANGVVGVGAINPYFERSCFSNYGIGANGPGGVDVVAPGGEANGSTVTCGIQGDQIAGITSSLPGNDYGSAVGTSMSAPMVSGVAALILTADPQLGVDELETRLLEAAYFDPSFMSRQMYGAGVLRADRALGLPGPGDQVEVELEDLTSGSLRRASVELGLQGASTGFSFDGIEASEYLLRAREAGTGSVWDEEVYSISNGQQLIANLVLERAE